MLKIESILNYIRNKISDGSDRFAVIDDEHVLDANTGIKLHIYDDWFKLTRNGEVIATMQDFDTGIEQPIIWEIKKLITKPEVISDKQANYMPLIKERREMLSSYFESPEPITNKIVIAEDDAEVYIG